jgi:hypothetical protein
MPMHRWPSALIAFALSCSSSIESPRPAPSSPPSVFVEAPCIDPEALTGFYFDGRVGLQLPPGVMAEDLRWRAVDIVLTDRAVSVGCRLAPVTIRLFEIDATPTTLPELIHVLEVSGVGHGPSRLEFIRPDFEGFSFGMSSASRHAYTRVMMPSDDVPACYHAIQFLVRAEDWEIMLPTLATSARSMARLPHGQDGT